MQTVFVPNTHTLHTTHTRKLIVGFFSFSGDGSAARGEGDVCAGAYATSDDAHYAVAVGAHVGPTTQGGGGDGDDDDDGVLISGTYTHMPLLLIFRPMLTPMVQLPLDINLKLWE